MKSIFLFFILISFSYSDISECDVPEFLSGQWANQEECEEYWISKEELDGNADQIEADHKEMMEKEKLEAQKEL